MDKTSFVRELRNEKIVGVDSNVFIYQFESHPDFSPLTNELFVLIDKKQLKIVSSFISLVEILSFPRLEGQGLLIEKYKNLLLTNEGIQIIFPNVEISEKTAELRRKFRLKTPDALQIASAFAAGAKIFVTNDDYLAKIKDLPVKILLLKKFALDKP